MLKRKSNPGLALLALVVALNSCVSLRAVSDYSSSSLNGIGKFEDLSYSFTQHCFEKCRFEAMRNFEIKRDIECNCDGYANADSVTLIIYNLVRDYFTGLANLSRNDLTDYNFGALKTSLSEGDFGDIKIGKEQVDAYSRISKILLKAATDAYRRKKLKKYLEEANEPVQVLLKKFQFIIQKNLEGELDFKKETLYAYYKEMNLGQTLNDFEKGKATIDYYQQLSNANTLQQQIDVFAKSLEVISEGHRQLYENRNKLKAKEMKEALGQYTGEIRGIISEFNKLKK